MGLSPQHALGTCSLIPWGPAGGASKYRNVWSSVGRETLHMRHKVGAKSPGVGAWVSLESLLGQPRDVGTRLQGPWLVKHEDCFDSKRAVL